MNPVWLSITKRDPATAIPPAKVEVPVLVTVRAATVVVALKVLVPVKVWPARLRRATFDESCPSAIAEPEVRVHAPLIAKHPPERSIPFANVEVAAAEIASAPVELNEPPVMVRPFDEARPAVDTAPLKLEVPSAVEVKVPVTARLVVVACEVVALSAVKFWRVVEESAVSEPGKT